MSRTRELAEDGAKWIKEGGYVDFTARSSATVRALTRYFASGVNLDHVTVSTDAGGSCPSFDDKGELITYKTMGSDSMLWLIRKLHYDLQWPLQRVLPLVTRNCADYLKLTGKGQLAVGFDADILLLTTDNLDVKYVLCKGKKLLSPDDGCAKAMFED